MSNKAYQSYNTKQTPQNQPIPGRDMVQNNAGGFTFSKDDWARLDNFLILGSEGNTYYSKAKELTLDNARIIQSLINEDGQRVVARTVEISEAGRAAKNTPALFVLAMCAAAEDDLTRKVALKNLGKVARIATHLFTFIGFVEQFRGWGRSVRSAIANWYLDKSDYSLARQVIKYQHRDGWTHKDVLKLAHPKATTGVKNDIFNWIINGWENIGPDPHPNAALVQIWAMERMKTASETEICQIIKDYAMPFETVPTQFLKSARVWEALLPGMGLEAMTRNLGRMTANGTFDNQKNVYFVAERLNDVEALKKERLHPMKILIALSVYKNGHGEKGDLTWTPVTKIINALDSAFYKAFQTVESTGKRWLLALDVSGSMDWPQNIIPGTSMTARVASAAMAMVTEAVEPSTHVVAFTSGNYHSECKPIDLTSRRRLDDNLQMVDRLPAGGTDCALPMIYAKASKIPVDVFVIYTDNETWFGNIHPSQALRDYRKAMGINAKLIVVAMTSNGFSIADPKDSGMMDVVGFDTAVPQLMAQFAAG